MGLANNRKKENVFYMSLRFLEMLFIITRDGTIRDKSSDKSENNDIISSGSKQPSTVKHKKAILSCLGPPKVKLWCQYIVNNHNPTARRGSMLHVYGDDTTIA